MAIHNIIVFAAGAFGVGIWYSGEYRVPSITSVCLFVVLLIAIVRQFVYNTKIKVNLWPFIGLFFVAGVICYSFDTVIRQDDISRYAGQTVAVQGIIADVPEIDRLNDADWLGKYIVQVKMVKPEGSRDFVRSSGKVRLGAIYKEKPIAIKYGDSITASGKVLELHSYNNPGQLDTTIALKRQGIHARMSAQGSSIRLVKQGEISWQSALAAWQKMIVEAFQKVMPVNDAAILTAVLFSGYDGISKTTLDSFKDTGLIHILSVSGAHIALVAGVMRWLGGRLGLGLVPTITLASITVVLYAVISGLTPPVVRSAIMGQVSLLAVIMGRDNYAPAVLSVTALVMLTYQPMLLYDISFQLSFGATAGLVFLYQPTMNYLEKLSLPKLLAGPLAVTLSAQLGVMPFIAWYFNSFPLISFLANLVIIPIVELVIILGLSGVIIYTMLPLAGNLIFVAASLLIGLVTGLTTILASFPGSLVYIPSVGLSGSLVYYLALAWVYGWRPLGMPGPRELAAKYSKQCAIISLFILVFFIGWNWHTRDLAVHFIDVGQGDATLITTPNGRAVLVDTGGSFNGSSFDVGERVVAPYLKHYGVTAVDYLILTHGHQDHAGGAAGVAGDVRVTRIILPLEEYSPAVRALLKTEPAARVIGAATGQTFKLDGVTFAVEHAVNGENEGKTRTGNEVSSVIRVIYGKHSFLLTGDLEALGETELLAQNIRPCTVLKVGHHGARSSTSQLFLQAVTPEYAVISAGYANRFGHPHKETLQRLEAAKTRIYRTDKQGAIVFKSDGNQLKVETYIKSK